MAAIESKIRQFSTLELAKSFFENNVQKSDAIDGFWIKQDAYFSVERDGVYLDDLNSESPVYLVITYPHGTAFSFDSGKTEAQAPANAEGSSPATDTGATPT